ncbi:MAG: NAD(P)H-hydrate epimerase [Chloroflexi bacterium]|nr:NAD(P)H-hydrate epimerase [Chloroflexota bacterium]
MTRVARALFHTEAGLPVPAVSVAEMREIDRVAAEQTGPGLLQMMEHAGMGLALTALEMLGAAWPGARVIVLAGTGGNGGGGICAARHLANRGLRVLVVTVRAPAQADGTLGQQFLALGESPARVIRWSEAFDAASADLVIDAVIGYGLEGEPRAAQMALIRAANGSGTPVLSLDVPSGVDADSGRTPGAAVRAHRTLTLALPKRGLNPESAGELWLQDLGIPPGVYARAGIAFEPLFGPSDRARLRYPASGEPGGPR